MDWKLRKTALFRGPSKQAGCVYTGLLLEAMFRGLYFSWLLGIGLRTNLQLTLTLHVSPVHCSIKHCFLGLNEPAHILDATQNSKWVKGVTLAQEELCTTTAGISSAPLSETPGGNPTQPRKFC